MRAIRLISVLSLMMAVGCQTGPRVNRHIELLNGEKRALEDQLYEMEFELEDAQEEIGRLRAENDYLRQRSGMPPDSRAPAIRPQPKPFQPAPKTTNGSKSIDLEPPKIEEGMLSEPKIEIPGDSPVAPPAKSRPSEAPIPPVPESSSENRPAGLLMTAPEPLEPADPRITHIYLNPLLTGGSDFDRQPGDDGLTVSIEPRNADNAFVPLAGPISIVLLDPALENEAARVARWDLDAEDTQQAMQGSGSTRGIQLRLPWSSGAPSNNRLQLFVRYVTTDGRKLEASREVFITLPGQFSQRWTPRASGTTTGQQASQSAASDTSERSPPTVASDTRITGPADQVRAASHLEPADTTSRDEHDQQSANNPPIPSWQPNR